MGMLEDLIKRRNMAAATPVPTDAQRIAAKGGNYLRLGEKMRKLGSPDLTFPGQQGKYSWVIDPADTNAPTTPSPANSPMQLMANRMRPQPAAPAAAPVAAAPMATMAPRTTPAASKPQGDQSVENIRGVLGMPHYEAGDRIAGNLLVDSTTGKPKGLVKAAAIGVNDANTMVDNALERGRLSRPFAQHYSQGLGTGVGPANLLAKQKADEERAAGIQSALASNRAWFDARRAQMGSQGVTENDSNGPRTDYASGPIPGYEAPAAPIDPERQARAEAYSERMKAQRDQANQAQGLRARMAVGKPLNQQEAEMFANQAAAQQEAALSGRLAQTNPGAALQAAQNNRQLQAKTAQSLQELALRQSVADAQIASAQSREEIEKQRLANEQAKQEFLQSPQGVSNGMLLGGATAKELQDAGLPLPGVSTNNPVSTAPSTAAVIAGAQANQQLRTLPPDAQLASLEGLLRASQTSGFNVNDALSAGLDEQQLMAMANADLSPSYVFDPNLTLGKTLDSTMPKSTYFSDGTIDRGLTSMIPDFIKKPIANFKPLQTGIGASMSKALGGIDIAEYQRRAELQQAARRLADMIRNKRGS